MIQRSRVNLKAKKKMRTTENDEKLIKKQSTLNCCVDKKSASKI
jgi:hypothetical protein